MVSISTSLIPVEIYELNWPAIRADIHLAGQSRAEAEMTVKNGRMPVPLRRFSNGTSKSEAYPLPLSKLLCSLHNRDVRLIIPVIPLVSFLSLQRQGFPPPPPKYRHFSTSLPAILLSFFRF